MRVAARQRITPNFTLGGEQAETDPLLDEAFYNSSIFEAITSKRDPRRFLVGRTGSGKSAILQRLQDSQGADVSGSNPGRYLFNTL